jgi:hypothetical protein
MRSSWLAARSDIPVTAAGSAPALPARRRRTCVITWVVSGPAVTVPPRRMRRNSGSCPRAPSTSPGSRSVCSGFSWVLVCASSRTPATPLVPAVSMSSFLRVGAQADPDRRAPPRIAMQDRAPDDRAHAGRLSRKGGPQVPGSTLLRSVTLTRFPGPPAQSPATRLPGRPVPETHRTAGGHTRACMPASGRTSSRTMPPARPGQQDQVDRLADQRGQVQLGAGAEERVLRGPVRPGRRPHIPQRPAGLAGGAR